MTAAESILGGIVLLSAGANILFMVGRDAAIENARREFRIALSFIANHNTNRASEFAGAVLDGNDMMIRSQFTGFAAFRADYILQEEQNDG